MLRKTLRSLALFCSVAAAAAPAPPQQIRLSTSEQYDPKAVKPFAGNYPDIYSHIDTHHEAHFNHIAKWVRQPSISADGQGIGAMAELLRSDLEALGFKETQVVPTKGHPGVWGYFDAGAETTLAVYMMYDVQPVERADWKVDPFAGKVVDHELGKVLMARGAVNQKGPQRAFLNAVESILAVKGKLPVNLMVLADGEEEIGSVNFPALIERFRPRLRQAAGVLFPGVSQSPDGGTTITLGEKGILYFEMEAKGGAHGGPKTAEVHSGNKAILDSPTWRLVQALASLTSPDGNTITVPGYYDSIRAPTLEEQKLVNSAMPAWVAGEDRHKRVLGVDRWINGISRREALLQSVFGTTLNINGISSGYTGPGTKTILPHKGIAMLDSRLVPDQTPEKALQLIRMHLNAKGFKDVIVRDLGSTPPSQTSVTQPLVRTVLAATNKRNLPVRVTPRIQGSATSYLLTQGLGLPMISAGLGTGGSAHAPNEFLLIEANEKTKAAGLKEMENYYVDLLHALAGQR